jgi:hypothetical protein
MASDPRSPPPINALPGLYGPDVSVGGIKHAQIPADIIKKMSEEKERQVKRQMYDHLLDAFKYQAFEPWNTPTLPLETMALGDAIRAKIEEHRRMIAALEWFAAHVSLDNPNDNALVGRIVLEGLRALTERNR